MGQPPCWRWSARFLYRNKEKNVFKKASFSRFCFVFFFNHFILQARTCNKLWLVLCSVQPALPAVPPRLLGLPRSLMGCGSGEVTAGHLGTVLGTVLGTLCPRDTGAGDAAAGPPFRATAAVTGVSVLIAFSTWLLVQKQFPD